MSKAMGARTTSPAPQPVSPRWLLRAVAGTLLAALLCGYLTFCVLFFQGQWQLVLHPARPGRPLPARIGSAVPEKVSFSVDAGGRPQLAGVWLRGNANGRYGAGRTLLYLPSGDDSVIAAADRLAELQEFGFNVFAVDYRGYGTSAATRPSQKHLEQDSEAALDYVLQQRHVPAERVVLYGAGVGGYLAARLASQHVTIPVVVLEAARFNLLDNVLRDPRVRLLPVRLLFHQRFDLVPLLRGLTTPKLLLCDGVEGSECDRALALPGMSVSLPVEDGAHRRQALTQFFDQYVPEKFASQAP